MPRVTLALDLSVQPYSVGDTILAIAGAHARGDEIGCREGLDVVLVADSRVRHADANMAAKHADPLASLGFLLPLLGLAPGLGSVTIHTDREQAPRFPAQYVTYEALELIAAYHRRHGHPPRLNFSPALCSWADRFLDNRVTVNLRANPTHHAHRNHDPEVWAKALERAAGELGLSFLVVGEAHEADPILRERPYIHFAKDYGTTLLQDLALVHQSKAHLGTCSGPMVPAILGTKPYFFTRADMKPHLSRYGGALREVEGGRMAFSWATERQRLCPEQETVAMLVDAIGALVRP